MIDLLIKFVRLTLESKENAHAGNEPDGAVLVATLNLVDLAGSESVKHTGAVGQRAKEGGKINQSLLSLSRVIHSLSQPGAHVNFRDSKLTRLLQPSLSGNAKMSIVCCITPAERYSNSHVCVNKINCGLQHFICYFFMIIFIKGLWKKPVVRFNLHLVQNW